MIRLAIVEDEENYIGTLREFVSQYGRENRVLFEITAFTDGQEILEVYETVPKEGHFELILMDIQMPGVDVMTAAARIREKDPEVLLMFITNRMDYAVRGYEVDALDYIVKPVEYFAFSSKLRRALARIPDRNKSYYMIGSKGEKLRLRTDQIYYVESEGHTLVFHTISGEYRIRERLQKLEEDLAGQEFFRCNKGYLVTLRHVDAVRDGWCFIGGDKLLVSRARKAPFLEALTMYLAKRK